MNAFYFLTFAIIGVTAFQVFVRLKISRPASLVLATLFALSPYHFVRNENHLLLSAYEAVPIGTLIGLSVVRGSSFFGKGRVLGGLLPRKLATFLLCLIIGSAGVYYAMFTLLMIVIALVATVALSGAIRSRRTWRTIMGPVGVAALICVVLVANLSPVFIYNQRHGQPKGVTDRLPFESDLYALNLTRMLLPLDSHRIARAAEFAKRYERNSPLIRLTLEPPESIGLVATLGYLVLLFGVPVAALRAGLRGTRAPSWVTRLAPVSLFATVFTLIAVGGGLSTFIAYFVSPQWRAWNRVSILLAFFGLIAVGVVVDSLFRRVRTSSRRTAAQAVIVPLLLLVGVYDQTNKTFILQKGDLREVIFRADQRFAQTVERALPADAEVYQLPYVAYPEPAPSPPLIGTYDNAIPYVLTTDLRWSWGGLRGRPADYPGALQGLPVEVLLPAVAAAGFEGLWIDRAAYKDGGAAIIGAAKRVTGSAPLLQPAPRARYAFFRLDGLVHRLGLDSQAPILGDITLHPFASTFGPGFYRLESDGKRTWRWAGAQADLEFDNPLPRRRTVVVSGEMVAATGGSVTAQLPDGSAKVVPSSNAGRHFEFRFDIPPGRSRVRFAASGSTIPSAPGDVRTIALGFYNPSVIDAAYLPLLGPVTTPATY
jgi:phosphoglycerol transferase